MSCYRHGHAVGGKTSPTYRSWKAMLDRCLREKDAYFYLYGGRGIKVCSRWQGRNGFPNFLADMGERPDGKTLDRFPNGDGNYEPGNCRWATPQEQVRNSKTAKLEGWDLTRIIKLRLDGKTHQQIADALKLSRQYVGELLNKHVGSRLAQQQPRTTCPSGHLLIGDNLAINANGARVCRTCQRRHYREYRKRKKAKRDQASAQ